MLSKPTHLFSSIGSSFVSYAYYKFAAIGVCEGNRQLLDLTGGNVARFLSKKWDASRLMRISASSHVISRTFILIGVPFSTLSVLTGSKRAAGARNFVPLGSAL